MSRTRKTKGKRPPNFYFTANTPQPVRQPELNQEKTTEQILNKTKGRT